MDKLFEDVDSEVIRTQLKQKLGQAETMLVNTALDLESAEKNPFVEDSEREMLRKIYNGRRFQFNYLKNRLQAIEDAVRKGS